MSESGNTETGFRYSLHTVASKLSSRGHRVYSARMVKSSRYGDDDLIRDVAAATNRSEAAIRYFEATASREVTVM